MQRLLVKILVFIIGIIVVDNIISYYLFKGLVDFTGIRMNSDVVFVGHSHTQCAIDAPKIQQYLGGSVQVTKVALHGMNLSDRLAILKYYFNSSKIKPKVVVFDIDDTILSKSSQNLNTHTRFYPFMNDPDMYKYIAENEADKSSLIARRFIKTLRYNNSWVLIRSLKGIAGVRDDRAPDITIDNPANKPLHTPPVSFDIQSEQLFDENITFLEKQKSFLVLAYYPKLFSNPVDAANHQKVLQRIQAIVRNRPNVFLDYNYDYGNNYVLFADTTHLNRKGQEVLSLRIAEDLRPMLVPSNNHDSIK